MGASCSVDKYKQIREKYGFQLSKMVIGEKNKLFLDRTISKLRKEISETAGKCQTNLVKQVKDKEQFVEEYYRKIKGQLDERQPGGIKSLQQMTGKTVSELLGFEFIKDLFVDLKESINQKFKIEENAMMDELLEIKIGQQEWFNEQKPNLTIYNDLQDDEKQGVIKRGQHQFHPQISNYQSYLLNRYGDKLTREFYVRRLNNITCKESLQGLVLVARDKLVTSLNLILAQRLGSYILFK